MASLSAAASALSSSAAELDAGSSSSVTSEPWEALQTESRLRSSQSSFPRPSAPKLTARSAAEAASVERAAVAAAATSWRSPCCCGCCIEKSEPDDDEASTCVGCGKKKKKKTKSWGDSGE